MKSDLGRSLRQFREKNVMCAIVSENKKTTTGFGELKRLMAEICEH